MSTVKWVLQHIGLDSIEEGTKIYIYRVSRGKLSCEEGVANVVNGEINEFRCGRYDKNGKLTIATKVAQMEGVVYSTGASDTVWFLKPNKRKAKKLLREIFEERLAIYQTRLDRTAKIIKEELK